MAQHFPNVASLVRHSIQLEAYAEYIFHTFSADWMCRKKKIHKNFKVQKKHEHLFLKKGKLKKNPVTTLHRNSSSCLNIG